MPFNDLSVYKTTTTQRSYILYLGIRKLLKQDLEDIVVNKTDFEHCS